MLQLHRVPLLGCVILKYSCADRALICMQVFHICTHLQSHPVSPVNTGVLARQPPAQQQRHAEGPPGFASSRSSAAGIAGATRRGGAGGKSGCTEPRAGGASRPLRGAAAACGSAASPGPVRSSPLVFVFSFSSRPFSFSFRSRRPPHVTADPDGRAREAPPHLVGEGRAQPAASRPGTGWAPRASAEGTAAFRGGEKASSPGCPRREPGGGRRSGPGVMTRFLSSRRGSALESAAAAAAEPAGAGGRRGGRKEGRKETSGGGARRGDAAVTPLSVGVPSDPRPDRCAERRSALRRGERGVGRGGSAPCRPQRAELGRSRIGAAVPVEPRETPPAQQVGAPRPPGEPSPGKERAAPPRLPLAGSGTGRRGNPGSFGILPAAGGAAPAPHSGRARGAVRLHAPRWRKILAARCEAATSQGRPYLAVRARVRRGTAARVCTCLFPQAGARRRGGGRSRGQRSRGRARLGSARLGVLPASALLLPRRPGLVAELLRARRVAAPALLPPYIPVALLFAWFAPRGLLCVKTLPLHSVYLRR